MTEQQTKIDPETFAYHFMETIHRPDWLLFDPKIQSFGK